MEEVRQTKRKKKQIKAYSHVSHHDLITKGVMSTQTGILKVSYYSLRAVVF